VKRIVEGASVGSGLERKTALALKGDFEKGRSEGY